MKRAVTLRLVTPYGTFKIPPHVRVDAARLEAGIKQTVASLIIRLGEIAKEYTEARFDAFKPALSGGHLTEALKKSYLKSLEASEIDDNSGDGRVKMKAKFFSYDVLNEGVNQFIGVGDGEGYKISWWKIHEFGSPTGSTPLSSEARVYGGKGVFIPKKGAGFFGEGFFMSNEKISQLDPEQQSRFANRALHPGVVPIRNLITLAPYMREAAAQLSKEAIAQHIISVLIGGA